MVDPLRFALESRDLGQARDLVVRILVAVLSPDGFAVLERDLQIGGVNRDGLLLQRLQMHLDASGLGIESRQVTELIQLEIRIQLAIDADQKIEIERGRDSQRIVIRLDESGEPIFRDPCPAAAHRRS